MSLPREGSMNADTFGSVEMQMLWLSIVLGLVQLVLAVLPSLAARGLPWAAGPRDEPGAALGKIGGRLERAFRNFLETFVFFAAAVLMAQALGRHGGNIGLGAQVYFWSRLAYVPAYAAGIPFLRTLLWGVSVVGIVLVLVAIHPGM
jgi:uncharacterized MAPEG superfamily protein